MIRDIFQVLISDGPVDDSRFSDELVRNISSFRSLYPDASYKRYENDEIIQFLSQSFPKEVLAAYQALTPYAFKADLARYCILYEKGGLYSDLSYLHLRPLAPRKKTELVVFRDVPGHPAWTTSNAIIYAKPKVPALERAINRIVEHHKSRYYGHTPLDPTGPVMFGRVLCEVDDWKRTVFGDSQLLSRESNGRPNILKVLPSGEVIALRNKVQNSSINEMIDGHSNNYADLWGTKRVWGEVGLMDRVSATFGRQKRLD